VKTSTLVSNVASFNQGENGLAANAALPQCVQGLCDDVASPNFEA